MHHRGLLTNEPLREASWVGITLVKKIVTAILEDAVVNGTCSWDVTISKLLSIVLLGTMGARAGDIGLSIGYTGMQVLQWKHIELKLKQGTPPVLDNLCCRITITFEKGSK